MSSIAQVAIHASQFPENVRSDLVESLRRRQVNHKFHYDSLKQTQKWLALHEAYSPSRTDPDCARTYDRSFEAAAGRIKARRVHLLGLGCGGGQKDTRLLRLLRDSGREVFYTPVDVSTAMVLVARQAASGVLPEGNIFPLVCDLATASDLAEVVGQTFGGPLTPARSPSEGESLCRLITFFGMMPNFEPGLILPRLAELVRRQDCLLVSANLAPGADYEAGVGRILPLYDNAPTRDWLVTFLLDLGVARADGDLRFVVEDDPEGSGLKRVAAYFHFSRSRSILLEGERFEFGAGEAIRLFFSYRHTPELLGNLLGGQGLRVAEQWVTRSGEEGVFLATRGAEEALGGLDL
jgi:SAM-dependent methyltransferase